MNAAYPKYLEEHLELKSKPNHCLLVGQKLVNMWKNLSAKEKASFEDQSKQLAVKYEQVNLFRISKHIYFLIVD